MILLQILTPNFLVTAHDMFLELGPLLQDTSAVATVIDTVRHYVRCQLAGYLVVGALHFFIVLGTRKFDILQNGTQKKKKKEKKKRRRSS